MSRTRSDASQIASGLRQDGCPICGRIGGTVEDDRFPAKLHEKCKAAISFDTHLDRPRYPRGAEDDGGWEDGQFFSQVPK
jgi:hypothetical protein